MKHVTVRKRQGECECLNRHNYAADIVGHDKMGGRFIEYALERREFCCWQGL